MGNKTSSILGPYAKLEYLGAMFEKRETIIELEKVQKGATKLMGERGQIPSLQENIGIFVLFSSEKKVRKGDMIIVYKVKHDM